MDLHRGGCIGYCAFIGAMIMMPLSLRSNETLCDVAFSILDRGKDGYIDCADLAAVVAHEKDRETRRNI